LPTIFARIHFGPGVPTLGPFYFWSDPDATLRGVKRSRKRAGPPLPPVEPLDGPGSWLPEEHRQPGDVVACAICGRPVVVVPPPEDRNRDPWPGSQVPRVEPHWPKPLPEGERGN